MMRGVRYWVDGGWPSHPDPLFFSVGLGMKGLTPKEKLRKTKTIIHWHVLLFPVLLLEGLLRRIGSIDQFLNQQFRW
jgi:hypothetical protein